MPIPFPPIPQPPGIPPSNPPDSGGDSGGGSGGGSSSPPPPPPPPPQCYRYEWKDLVSRVEPLVFVIRKGERSYEPPHIRLTPLWSMLTWIMEEFLWYGKHYDIIRDGKYYSNYYSFDAINIVWIKREGDNIVITAKSLHDDITSLFDLQDGIYRPFPYVDYNYITEINMTLSLLNNVANVMYKYKKHVMYFEPYGRVQGWEEDIWSGQETRSRNISDWRILSSYPAPDLHAFDYLRINFLQFLNSLEDGESVLFLTPFGNPLFCWEIREWVSNDTQEVRNYTNFFQRASSLITRLTRRLGSVVLTLSPLHIYYRYEQYGGCASVEQECFIHNHPLFQYQWGNAPSSFCEQILAYRPNYYGSYAFVSDLETIIPSAKISIDTGQSGKAIARITQTISTKRIVKLKEVINSIAKTKIESEIIYRPQAQIKSQVQGNKAIARIEQHILQPAKISESITYKAQASLVEFIYKTRLFLGFKILESIQAPCKAQIQQDLKYQPTARIVEEISAFTHTQQIQPQAGIVQSVVNKLQARIRQNILSKAQAKVRINIAGNTSHVVRIYEDSEHIMLMLM
ncbi:MAG: hypothetical protein QW733_06095 [Desulfurococcaceae archaeon]